VLCAEFWGRVFLRVCHIVLNKPGIEMIRGPPSWRLHSDIWSLE